MSMTINSAGRRAANAAALLSAAALLAGCAINTDLRLDAQGPGLPARAAVAIQAVPAGNQQTARFATALTDAFAASGHAVNDAAPVTAVFGFAVRPRSAGTADATPSPDAAPAEIRWISAPARKRAFQSCAGERMRATLALYSRQDKTLIYRGTGEVDGCAFMQSDIDALAQALVAAAARKAG
jgi:hypothetical protein